MKLTTQEATDRLADAFTYHREHPPVGGATRLYCRNLGIRFSISPKIIEAALITAAMLTTQTERKTR